MQFLKDKLTDTKFDFVGMRRTAAIVSGALVLLSWVVFVVVGPNWGIDFTGGTEMHLEFAEQTEISEVRSALRELGLADDSVQQVGAAEDNQFTIRIQDATFGSEAMIQGVFSALDAKYGADWVNKDKTRFDAEVGARMSLFYSGEEKTAAQVKEALADVEGVGAVEEGREDKQIIIRFNGLSDQIAKELSVALDGKQFEVLALDAVGPKVGDELKRSGFISVFATLGLVLLYVAFRFDIGFAPGAVVALFHDVSITVGIFVLMQREFNLPMIGALLTIVGYSLNDTIVIYDRIRENMDRYSRSDLAELINVSINETLGRTLATSLTTALAISAFLFLGGPVIQNFALAMLLGVVFGTYSTIFVATPMILFMEDVKPHLARMIAGSGPEEDGGENEEEVDLDSLSESEKRRRARQAAEQPSRT
ncbi:MAG: protein translocase subunit SecF [Deltaproteobacteria bacterium]|nr:MAG: protein translocase subunit SecF [Deltaproteobacteria bacterium]